MQKAVQLTALTSGISDRHMLRVQGQVNDSIVRGSGSRAPARTAVR